MWSQRRRCAPRTPRILVIGDSLTASSAIWRLLLTNSERVRLGGLAAPQFVGGVALDFGQAGSAASGWETDDALTQATLDVPLYRADVGIIWIGTNDAQKRGAGTGTPPTRAASVANVSSTVDLFATALAHVILVDKLQPNTTAAKETEMVATSAAVRTMILAHSWYLAGHVTIVDLWTPTTAIVGWDVSQYTDDTHYNDTGNAIPAAAFATAMATAWPVR